MSFQSFSLDPRIAQGLVDAGYTEATPLQQEVLPPALNRKNLLVKAKSGQGKDGSFIIPVLAHSLQAIEANKTELPGVRAVILTASPPRVGKIDELIWVMAYHAQVQSAQLLYKGDREVQAEALKSGVPVLVSNPRYFGDLVRDGKVDLSKLQVLVFDELDTLLNEGDAKHLYTIIESIQHPFQVLAYAEKTARSMEKVMSKASGGDLQSLGFDDFSVSTPKPKTADAESESQHTSASTAAAPPPVQVPETPVPTPSHKSDSSAPDLPVLTFKDIPKGTSQSYIRVPSRLKITTLTALVEEKAIPRLVVYTASKRGSDRLFRVFKSQQRQVVRVNSRQSVEERTEMMGRFNSGDADLILVSEVSTQDIDLNGVDYLINYDVPDTFSDYVLRMQRAKTSQNLQVVSLVSDTDTEAIERLQDKQPDTLPEWPLPERAQKKFEEKKARAARSDDRQPRKPRGKRGGRPKERTNTSSEEKNSKPPSRDNRPRRKNSPVDRAKDQKSAPKTNRPPKRKKRTEAAKLTELPKADFAALDRQKEKKKGGILGKIKSWFN